MYKHIFFHLGKRTEQNVILIYLEIRCYLEINYHKNVPIISMMCENCKVVALEIL